jgi:hypothetical protein
MQEHRWPTSTPVVAPVTLCNEALQRPADADYGRPNAAMMMVDIVRRIDLLLPRRPRMGLLQGQSRTFDGIPVCAYGADKS